MFVYVCWSTAVFTAVHYYIGLRLHQPDILTAISFDGGTDRPSDIAQLHWPPLLSCCRCAHLEQSSAIRNSVAFSVDFSEEIENWTVSEIVHDCQSSVTQYFLTWPWNFYRASICEGGLGSRNFVRPSVRLSVCLYVRLSHACIVTKLRDALQIFLQHTKGQSFCYSDTKSGWSATPHSLWNLRSKWPTPVLKMPTSTDFRS